MDEQSLYRWLAAESEGRDEESEQRLFSLFRTLPEVEPHSGFENRVLVAAGVVSSWRMRLAVGGGMLTTGLAAAFLVPLTLWLLGQVALGDIFAVAARGITTTANALDELVYLWQFLAQLRETLWLVVATPPVLLTLLTMTAIATLAGRFLAELLSSDRSPGYA